MDRIASLAHDVEAARFYTKTILDAVEQCDWFLQPNDGVTHVAWQVGHLAVAQYRLALLVVRGQKPGDEQLISQDFTDRFGPGSVPDPDPSHNPSVEEILDVFDRVHAQTVLETQMLSPNLLDEPVGFEHLMFSTKGGAIRWSAHHEFTHAGQISLLRRMLGKEFRW